MVRKFIRLWHEHEAKLRASLAAARPVSYEALFKRLVEEVLSDAGNGLDPARITSIDHGHYQGTQVFVVAECGYQPNRYWAYLCSYGSCSGCDTFQQVQDNRSSEQDYFDSTCEGEELKGYMDMALHMVQGLRPIHEPWRGEEE